MNRNNGVYNNNNNNNNAKTTVDLGYGYGNNNNNNNNNGDRDKRGGQEGQFRNPEDSYDFVEENPVRNSGLKNLRKFKY